MVKQRFFSRDDSFVRKTADRYDSLFVPNELGGVFLPHFNCSIIFRVRVRNAF